MSFDGAIFTTPTARAVAFWREFNCLAQFTVLAPWHGGPESHAVFKDSGFTCSF